MSARTIEVIIDEIIVHGALGQPRDDFGARVGQELSRLLRKEGGLAGLSELSSRAAGASVPTVTLAPGEPPGAAQVARAVHRVLRR